MTRFTNLELFACAEAPKPDANVLLGSGLRIAPLDATFRDGLSAPLHSWFPYLEGYSPRFVERVREAYLATATRIIEPFAGSGTTPIVLGQHGVNCAFAEANPAMAFVARTKLSVLSLSGSDQGQIGDELRQICEELPRLVDAAEPDQCLDAAYSATFGNSVFFDEAAKHAVLRLRTLNDQFARQDALLGDCFSVAVVSSLIPSSRLKRAGDLRYRNERELKRGIPDVLDVVRSRLANQARDLKSGQKTTADARFACESAERLHDHLDADWDGAITSPPYLNGTNYIRNARLELWYLRHLREASDLRRLRDRVITSGINDVHARTDWRAPTPGVEHVLRLVQIDEYDARIAKMIGGYFNDMSAVFSSLHKCVRRNGMLCIDIGDSYYNGVHVPTDDLLIEVAGCVGFDLFERVHLRSRVSKGGQPVRQQLLVLRRA